MTRSRWLLAALLAAMIAAAAWSFLRDTEHAAPATGRTPGAGGALVATLRSEPATFNRFTGTSFPTHVVSELTQGRLVRINRATQQLEPWLADRWTLAGDGRTYTLHLRPDVRFADGQPFTADDVVFSFEAAYDAKTASPLGDSLRIGGKPLQVRATRPSEIVLTFPEPYGPGLRLLDSLPIYPKHRLAQALRAGTFAAAWGPKTPPGEMTGLGPFVLAQYDPGQRLVFTRNPHYWRRDGGGRPLPYLDRITLELVPDQNAELLRLQAGQIDLMQSELRPEDYLPLKRDADAGRLRILDVGPSLDTQMLWFNLGSAGVERAWMRRSEFRRALSHAVDRAAFVRTVFLGAGEPAWGIVSPANRTWYSDAAARPAYDPDRARALLAGIGLTNRNGSPELVDASGAPVRFTLLVQKGISASEKGAAFLREAFATVGVGMDVVALDLAAVMGRWGQGDYDAIYHFLSFTDTDPGGNMDFWLSSGGLHLWHPGQATPATDWEARVDALMRQQAAALELSERQRLFAEVQQTLGDHVPALTFARQHVYVGTSPRITGARPAVQRPQLLWDVDQMSVAGK